MQKKGILFDFNGTMFFDGPKHKIAWDRFSMQYRNRPISDEELSLLHGQTNKRIIERLLGEVSEEASIQLSLQKEALYRECCQNDAASFHLAKGLPRLLDELKQAGVPMTICSASIRENIDFFIRSFHLETWFQPEHIVYDDGTHTNKISMFRKGAELINVPLQQCIVFEDSISGIQFAHEAGAAEIIAVASENAPKFYQRFPYVKRVISDFQQLHKEQLAL